MDLIRHAASEDADEQALETCLGEVDEVLSFKGLGGSAAASAHRLRGELLESLNRLADALDAYERALELDPKVGVKVRLKQLRTRLSGP